MGLSAYIDEPLLYPTHMLEEVARERRETALCEANALMNPNGATPSR